MSIEVMSWVWKKSTATGNDKFVLLAIADNAWDDGSNAWPSVTTIARKTGLGIRTVQRCIKNLEDRGELAVMERNGHSNLYRVIMADTQSPEPKPKSKEIVPVVPRAKKTDDVWDTLMAVCGVNSETINSQERGRHNKAVKALKESGATPGEIEVRARRYAQKFPNTVMTPIALASHWSELDMAMTVAVPQQQQPIVPKGWDAIKQAREERGA